MKSLILICLLTGCNFQLQKEPECVRSIAVYKDGDALSSYNKNGNSTEYICMEYKR